MATTLFQRSGNIELLRESATIAVSQRARALRAQGRRIIDLGAGEPDFDTPAFIRQAAWRAMEAGHTRYTATEGILPLREVIAARAGDYGSLGATVTAQDVVVSNGSKQSIFNACFVLFGAGDEVLIPTPSWTSYYEIVQLARATPVPVHGAAANDLKVTIDQLEAAATERTRGLMLNSPCNPTGAVYSREELRDLLALAQRRGWWVISDEIYRRIAYEDEAPSALEVADDRDQLIVVDGVAKAFAMTGWRVGWAIAPREVTQAMTAFQSHATFHTASISQHAAVAALTERAPPTRRLRRWSVAYRSSAVTRRCAYSRRVRDSAPFGRPVRSTSTSMSRRETSAGRRRRHRVRDRLLEEAGVAVVPGSHSRRPTGSGCRTRRRQDRSSKAPGDR